MSRGPYDQDRWQTIDRYWTTLLVIAAFILTIRGNLPLP